MSWADDHGYQHISCSCGWKGWTDTGVCEGCDAGSGRGDLEECDGCGCEMGDLGGPQRSATAEDDCLCEDCACEEGVSHHTTTKASVHVARKEHRDGYILPGDTYKRVAFMGFIVGGGRWLRVSKRLIKRAAVAA